MRWIPKSDRHRVDRKHKTGLYAWHDWFAWWPVKTESGHKVWLERIQRRHQDVLYAWLDRLVLTDWEYRCKDEHLKEKICEGTDSCESAQHQSQ